jgi:hypothetical protein
LLIMGWTMLALGAVQAVSSYQQGEAAKAEADYNATLIEGKAGLIDVQKDIEKGQYQRLKGQVAGKSMAAMAASGVMASGSPMAVMLDTQKQIELDQAIGQFNLEQQKRYTMAEAENVRRQGRQARTAGRMGAFTSLLSAGANYAMYKGYMNKPSSFDTSAGATRAGRA